MDDFLGIITAEEIERLRHSRSDGNVHPLVNIAGNRDASNNSALTAWNTTSAARLIASKDIQWLKGLHPRLTAADDFTQASSALGEIRAYGALLDTWVKVRPAPKVLGSKVSPEFEIDNRDGAVIVEVHTRQLDEEQAALLDTAAKELKTNHAEKLELVRNSNSRRNVVTIGIKEVTPTGAPKVGKKGDTILTNTISRIASVKKDEKQVDPNKPFILWLDLQDNGVGSPACPRAVLAAFFSTS
jgi:hypothetical protein